ncbi:hypothetical protein J3P88_03915 [Pseudomonas sp. Z3-6]|uniref:hypothetical protein n=1 Tax=Pseudomonas sp. Z3-6 TaxID=2817411 RepID=UPI003DA835F8
MKSKPSMVPLIGLLFVFNIENVDDEQREEIIVSKNVNSDVELSELFEILLKPEFMAYCSSDQEAYIELIEFFLKSGDSFDDLFEYMDTYFDQEIEDQGHFMVILLRCLKRYYLECNHASNSTKK